MWNGNQRSAIIDVSANSQSALAYSEFAAGKPRLYGRIANVSWVFYYIKICLKNSLLIIPSNNLWITINNNLVWFISRFGSD